MRWKKICALEKGRGLFSWHGGVMGGEGEHAGFTAQAIEVYRTAEDTGRVPVLEKISSIILTTQDETSTLVGAKKN